MISFDILFSFSFFSTIVCSFSILDCEEMFICLFFLQISISSGVRKDLFHFRFMRVCVCVCGL